MKLKLPLLVLINTFSLSFFSCGEKKNKTTDEQSIIQPSNDGIVPTIDTTNLSDEASLLDAIKKVADANIADDKKREEDPSYSGHYLELTKLYTAVLKASNKYSESIADPKKALEYHEKFSNIQKTMYEK